MTIGKLNGVGALSSTNHNYQVTKTVSEPKAPAAFCGKKYEDHTVRDAFIIGGIVLASAAIACLAIKRGKTKGTKDVGKGVDDIIRNMQRDTQEGMRNTDEFIRAVGGEMKKASEGARPKMPVHPKGQAQPKAPVVPKAPISGNIYIKEKLTADEIEKLVVKDGYQGGNGLDKAILYRQHGINAQANRANYLKESGINEKAVKEILKEDEQFYALAEKYSKLIGRPLNAVEAQTLDGAWHQGWQTSDRWNELFDKLAQLPNNEARKILSVDASINKDFSAHGDFLYRCLTDANAFAQQDLSGLVFSLRRGYMA